MRVEISVESVDGGRVAAARVELCAGLSDGGLTPSAALIEAAAGGWKRRSTARSMSVRTPVRPWTGWRTWVSRGC
jgi:copper homeostasis protein CutC